MMLRSPPKISAFFFGFFFLILFLFPHIVFAQSTEVRDFSLTPTKPMVDTKINIAENDYVTVRTIGSGNAIYVPGKTIPWVSTPGDPGCYAGPAYLLPGINCWALIGRIGTGSPFYIGFERSLTSNIQGRLYLAINHQKPLTGSGQWTVRVIVNHVTPPPVPVPFLDLPWDGVGDNSSFDQAILEINAYFDHEYPLLSTGLSEPLDAFGTLGFDNDKPPRRSYSSHDGYDWGTKAGAENGDAVFAAADGCALFKDNCPACGNAILIDHANYYQTRYYHLQPTDLITTSTTQCVPVVQGQPIGKVGFSGNVDPAGEGGAHIHFMVIEDKNRDGDFEDNIPDGITDPFGWQSVEPDPWPNYSFYYNGLDRTGNKSYYLWTKPIPNLSKDIPANGGFFELEQYKMEFPAGASGEDMVVNAGLSPAVNVNDEYESVGPSLFVRANNLFGDLILAFFLPYTFAARYSHVDSNRYDLNTLTIFSSEDNESWQAEATTLDSQTQTATAQIDHLSYFTLAAKLKDVSSPQTSILLNGQAPIATYSGEVTLELFAQDNQDGLGVDYTAIATDSAGWQEYAEPITFSDDGNYTIDFYSVDRSENIELKQTLTFTIAKTPPEAEIRFDPATLSLKTVDKNSSNSAVTVENLSNNVRLVQLENLSGSKTVLEEMYQVIGKSIVIRVQTVAYNGGEPTQIPFNEYGVIYSIDHQKKITNLLQYFRFGNQYLKYKFDAKTNQTMIVRIENGRLVQNETREGMVLLNVTTNQGALVYSF